LTYSYFRREEWCVGAREDWRFSQFRIKFGALFPLLSLPVVFVSQHLFLVGISLPFYVVFTSATPVKWGNYAAVALAIASLGLSYVADTQLNQFMKEQDRREARGEKRVLILNTGIWYYSRHPNYLGETGWWWAVYAFVWTTTGAQYAWLAFGAIINTLCLIYVTFMVEDTMRNNRGEERRIAFDQYVRTTSCWIPFFKFKDPQKQE